MNISVVLHVIGGLVYFWLLRAKWYSLGFKDGVEESDMEEEPWPPLFASAPWGFRWVGRKYWAYLDRREADAP